MNSIGAPTSALTLSLVIQAVRALVGRWSGLGVLHAALGLLLYRRLGEIARRMEGLAARFRDGRVWRRTVREAAGGRGGAVRADLGERIWPLAFGWLVKAAAHEAAVFGEQLRVVLAQPDMQALLTAAPQAVRVLRPLCRMLAVETAVLRPGGVQAAPAVEKRVRAPRVPVDWGRVPLPRGVLSAARRAGFAKR